MERLTTSLLVVLALSASVFGQSSILEEGESGVMLSGGFGVNESATTVGASFGYSAVTIVDFGFGFAYASFDGDLSAVAISPFLSVFVLKQGRNNAPINVSISGAYEHDFYSARQLDLAGIDMTGDFGTIGIQISGTAQSTPTFGIQPFAGAGLTFGQIKLEDEVGNFIKESDETFSGRAGLSFIFETASTTDVVLTTSAAIAEDIFTFSLGLGLVLRTAPHGK